MPDWHQTPGLDYPNWAINREKIDILGNPFFGDFR